MKKSSFSFVALLLAAVLCSPAAVAGIVPEATARQVGAYFLSAQFGTKAIDARTVDLVYTIPNTTLNVPAIYFYNSPVGGYVMVAGVDSFDPIIGYSDEGQVDTADIPPAMLAFLNSYVQPIVAMQNSKTVPSPAIQARWDELLEQRLPYFGSAKNITRLTTSTWSQRWPYNAMTPSWQGAHCLTGCVATAMAQILYYWRYPKRGYGEHRYMPRSLPAMGMQEANFGEALYRYDLMSDNMEEETDPEAIDAVALLNYHCGVAVSMDYAPGSSGAYSLLVDDAMKIYFKYQNTWSISRQSSFFANNGDEPAAGDTLWCDTIYKEIVLHRRPVFYTAVDKDNPGGDNHHAFLCDGYNPANRFFRFNWGWGVMNNSCFCNLYTSMLYANNYNFSYEHSAKIFIQPPADSVDMAVTTVPELLPPYPNPATDVVHLPYRLEQSAAELTVYTPAGRLVERRTVYGNSPEVVVEVARYPRGLYIYRIGGTVGKFVVR